MAPEIPKDSIFLVTGVSGYIGSHVADQLMQAGFRIRGTTRNMSKVQGLSALWEKKFSKDRFEMVTVSNMSRDGAFDEAVKGVYGVAHVASNLSYDSDPNKVIPEVLRGIRGILKSAANEPSVKRFVYTSSSTAATLPIPNKEFTIDTDTWNDAIIKKAWAPPPYRKDRVLAVYGSSKTEGEKALWKFMEEQKPAFVANAILPNVNFGTILAKAQPTSSGMWIKILYDGNTDYLEEIPPQYFVDVQDTARLHVAALINPDVQSERIFAFAEPFTFNGILKILRKLRPHRALPADFADDHVQDRSKVANDRAIELLKTLGRPGFTGLAESINRTIQDW